MSLSRGGKFEDASQPKIGEAAYPYTGRSGYECMPSYYSDAQGPFGRNLAPAGQVPRSPALTRARNAGRGLRRHPQFWTGRVGACGWPGRHRRICTPVARRSGLVPQGAPGPRPRGASLYLYTNYCEALDQRHRQVTCSRWDRQALDEPGVTLSLDGKRRLTAPPVGGMSSGFFGRKILGSTRARHSVTYMTKQSDTLAAVSAGILNGTIRVIDLTVPLEPATPVIRLPPQFAPSNAFSMTEISRYDERGPAWYWNNFACGEHTGTHFDAPVHWVTGKDYPNNATHNIPVDRFIGPACVIDVSERTRANADFLLTVAVIEAWESPHGRIPRTPGCWCAPTGRNAQIPSSFSISRTTARTRPGFIRKCVPFLAKERDILGIGVETVGTDAGQAATFDPMFPCHTIMHGANQIRACEPYQSRQAAADRRDRHRAAAQDRQRLGQSAARAGARARLSASWPNVHLRVKSSRCAWATGQEFRGEGILAVTKALLQSGVAYVGGYQGAPISHLMDVLADSQPILDELGVHFEASASEATAAAMLAASINYPMRGAVTWKSTVGTNVAADALGEPRLLGRQGRGAHHPRRGLRRRREHHAGAHPRLCDEIADVAARSEA